MLTGPLPDIVIQYREYLGAKVSAVSLLIHHVRVFSVHWKIDKKPAGCTLTGSAISSPLNFRMCLCTRHVTLDNTWLALIRNYRNTA